MKDIQSKTILDDKTNQFYYEGLAEFTKYKDSNVATYLDEISRPNLLINGDFQVWQRGESFIVNDNSSPYTADRHRLSLSNVGDFTKITHSKNGFRLETTKVIQGANRYLCYQMEQKDFEKLKGKEVTFSIKVKKLTNSSKVNLVVYGDFGEEKWKEIILENTEFETYSFTYLFRTDILETSVLYTLNNISTEIGGGFEVAFIKLELGAFATPFYPRNYVEELAMCQRYFTRYVKVQGEPYAAKDATTYWYKVYGATQTTMRMNPKTILTSVSISNVPNVELRDVLSYEAYMNGVSYQWLINLKKTIPDSFYSQCPCFITVDLDAEIYEFKKFALST